MFTFTGKTRLYICTHTQKQTIYINIHVQIHTNIVYVRVNTHTPCMHVNVIYMCKIPHACASACIYLCIFKYKYLRSLFTAIETCSKYRVAFPCCHRELLPGTSFCLHLSETWESQRRDLLKPSYITAICYLSVAKGPQSLPHDATLQRLSDS